MAVSVAPPRQEQRSETRFVRPEVMKRLAEATRDEHQHIEANPLLASLMQVAKPLDHYHRTLVGFYGFYRPLEERLLRETTLADHPDLGFRLHKHHLIAQDLYNLGMTPEQCEQLPQCQDVPQSYPWYAALGVLYVMEGATLGGQIIRRHLLTHLEPQWHPALRFYDCYQEQVGVRWRQFQLLMATSLADDVHGQHLQQVIDAARNTFEQLDTWLLQVNQHTQSNHHHQHTMT